MATRKALDGKPYAGNPHVRFDEGEVAPAATPRRGSLPYKNIVAITLLAAAFAAHGAPWPKAIFSGDWPDPSILRDGEDFYMTFSGMQYRPGLTIWHSKNLTDWKQIAVAATNVAGDVWAPEIVKRKDGSFAIYFPADGVYCVTAPTMRGPWSEPVLLDGVKGIDPGVAGDWLWVNCGNAYRLAPDGLSVKGEARHFYDGWRFPLEWETETSSKILYLESPKLFKRGEWHYLVSAQGGTAGPATSHMAAVARAKSIEGPWENSPLNPLVHTYSAEEEWWSTGHATLFDDAAGNWWAVYHGYRKDFHTLGRHTLLAPVKWTDDGWPVLDMERPDIGEATTPEEWLAFPDPELDILAAKPAHRSYRAEAEVALNGGKAAISLFYNKGHWIGIDATSDGFAIHFPEGTTRLVPNTFGDKFTLSIQNDRNKASFFANGQSLAADIDVSKLNHNRLGGFASLRLALVKPKCSKATFGNFKYSAIE